MIQTLGLPLRFGRVIPAPCIKLTFVPKFVRAIINRPQPLNIRLNARYKMDVFSEQ